MNRLTLTCALLATALAAAPAALAQTGPAESGHGPMGMDRAAMEARMFEMLDTDGDGVISPEEWAARTEVMRRAGPLLRAEAIIERFDTDGDGSLNAEELATAMGELRGRMDGMRGQRAGRGSNAGMHSAQRRWMRAGAAMPSDRIAEMFARLDTDGDGAISPEEFEAGIAAMAGMGDGMRAAPRHRHGMNEAPRQRRSEDRPQRYRMAPQRGQ